MNDQDNRTVWLLFCLKLNEPRLLIRTHARDYRINHRSWALTSHPIFSGSWSFFTFICVVEIQMVAYLKRWKRGQYWLNSTVDQLTIPAHLKHKIFKDIWKWKGAERIKIFMWLAFLNNFPTNKWKSNKPMSINKLVTVK